MPRGVGPRLMRRVGAQLLRKPPLRHQKHIRQRHALRQQRSLKARGNSQRRKYVLGHVRVKRLPGQLFNQASDQSSAKVAVLPPHARFHL